MLKVKPEDLAHIEMLTCNQFTCLHATPIKHGDRRKKDILIIL